MIAFIQLIQAQVADVTARFAATIGFIGVLVGAVISVIGGVVTHYLRQRAQAKRDEPRRKLLTLMLEDDRFPGRWRKLDTLMHVIGSDEAAAKRLLLEIGARGSEDGQELWGLTKYHPFQEKI